MSVIGIVLGTIAIGLFFHFNKGQQRTNELVEFDIDQARTAYNALMNDFNNYQVETDRKIAELEKQLEIKSKESERKIMKLTENLPVIIRKVVGHIEFARPLDKK